jgi:hypothetical protein
MRTTDLFKNNRSAKRLNESLAKTFGRKLNLETFTIEQLEDARNKLRTQIYTARSSSSFNETVENDTLSKAQFMHDAIVAELAERDEPIVDNTQLESRSPEVEEFLTKVAQSGDDGFDMLYDAQAGKYGKEIEQAVQEMYDDITIDTGYHGDDDFEQIYDRMLDNIEADYGDRGSDDEGGDTDDGYALASAGHGSDEDYGSFNQGEAYDMDQVRADAVANIKKSIDQQSDDRMAKLKSDKNKGFMAKVGDKIIGGVKGAARGFAGKEDVNTNEAYINNADDAINLLAAIRAQSKMAERGGGEPVRPNQLVNDLWDVMQWIEHNMKESIETESKNTGDNMSNLREGEIQQASAIVTAKTMVDRVGRWIEELSGMENDTLLQLGDSIRDEMGQEQAKQFISTVAPAIQSALENLKQARETLSGGVRTLTGEEQPAEMLGGDPAADMAAPAEPDAMNAEPGADMAGDDFDAAEPAAGGIGDAGREQRESIDRQSRLLKVLAG